MPCTMYIRVLYNNSECLKLNKHVLESIYIYICIYTDTRIVEWQLVNKYQKNTSVQCTPCTMPGNNCKDNPVFPSFNVLSVCNSSKPNVIDWWKNLVWQVVNKLIIWNLYKYRMLFLQISSTNRIALLNYNMSAFIHLI